MTLAAKRCFNHPAREGALRCPECRRFFCRECAVEYQERLLCRECLDAIHYEAKQEKKSWVRHVKPVLALASGLFISWLVFYGLVQLLYSIPSYFHDVNPQYEKESK